MIRFPSPAANIERTSESLDDKALAIGMWREHRAKVGAPVSEIMFLRKLEDEITWDSAMLLVPFVREDA